MTFGPYYFVNKGTYCPTGLKRCDSKSTELSKFEGHLIGCDKKPRENVPRLQTYKHAKTYARTRT